MARQVLRELVEELADAGEYGRLAGGQLAVARAIGVDAWLNE